LEVVLGVTAMNITLIAAEGYPACILGHR
jgi:hypothetical protein